MAVQESQLSNSTASPTGAKEKATEAAHTVADAASSTASTASGATKDVVGQVTEQSKAVAGEAKAQAQQMLANTKTEVQQQADERARQAAEHLRGMSTSISALLDGRPYEATQISGYLQQAQGKIDGLVDRLDTAGPQGIIDDVSDFARRRPGAFLVAAGFAGFAIGRLARAGTAAAHDQQQNQQLTSTPQPLYLDGQTDLLADAQPALLDAQPGEGAW
jgi:hypothetical protein